MNLTFLNPLFLFGLAASILPILIHRITQKKFVVRKFSAVRLLLQSQGITSRSQRLKHILLLAMRILAVAAIVFMMARPVLVRPGFASLLKDGVKVVILDNSLSMGYAEERGERYQVAKRAAKEALEDFEGQVAIIPTVSPRGGPGGRWMKVKEALRTLEEMPLTYGRGNTVSALASAYGELRDLKIPKQIVILSDMARSDWEGLDLSGLGIISDAEVTFLRIGGPHRDSNFCIKSVNLVGGEMVAGIPTRLEVTVSNLSDQAGTTHVQVSLSEMKVAQKSIQLKSGQDGKVFFDLFVENPGWVDGEIKLSQDRLPSDDVFYFPLRVREKVKVLVTDGDPKTSLRASESYYLAGALRPGGLGGSPFLTRVITGSEVDRVDLRSYDTLFLLNVARPNLSRLGSFLESGRPVFIFLGDRIVPEAYNQFSLAPWLIGELVDLSERPERVTQIDTDRGTPQIPIRLKDSLKGASFGTYFKVAGSGKNLLTLKNQDPLLMEADAGKSKLFMFASSADLDWNDFPLTAAYLPLLHGLVKQAVGIKGTSLPEGITFGESFREESRPVQVKGPLGGPGIFQFRPPSGELRRGVNTPFEESDLAKLGEDELKKKFGAIDIKVVEYEEGGLKDLPSGRLELWPLLLGFLLAVLTFEMILANGMPGFRALLGRGWGRERSGAEGEEIKTR